MIKIHHGATYQVDGNQLVITNMIGDMVQCTTDGGKPVWVKKTVLLSLLNNNQNIGYNAIPHTIK